MNLNHINLPVADVAASQEFYTKYFGMKTVLVRGQNFLGMLRDESGMLLVLSHFDKTTDPIQYPKDFHIGFFFETREEVDQIHRRMIGDGIAAEAPKQMPGRWAFYIQDPGGVPVEIACLTGRGEQR